MIPQVRITIPSGDCFKFPVTELTPQSIADWFMESRLQDIQTVQVELAKKGIELTLGTGTIIVEGE